MTLSRRFFLASVISLEMGCCAPVRMTGLSPVLRAEVGAVDAAQGQRVGAAELVQLRQMSQKLFAGEHGLEALLGADAGDGAAGGDKKQTLLCGHRKSLHQED